MPNQESQIIVALLTFLIPKTQVSLSLTEPMSWATKTGRRLAPPPGQVHYDQFTDYRCFSSLCSSFRAGGRGVGSVLCFCCHWLNFFSSSCPCCGLLGCGGAAGLARGCDHSCAGRAAGPGSGARAGSGR